MIMFKFDSELGLTLLGIVAIMLIMGTILLVSSSLGIQTYGVLEVGSPCPKVFCAQQLPTQEIGRDWQRGIAYCQCDNGRIIQAKLFA
jgi:hypothetical protein